MFWHEPSFRLRRLTPVGTDAFFGYYDVPAFSPDGREHLAHSTSFRDRLPAPGDEAKLMAINLSTGASRPLATTTAWNFQQASLAQWYGGSAQRIILNERETSGAPVGVIRDLATGAVRRFAQPLANVSRDGRWGLSVSFARLFEFRPGYGHAAAPDPHVAAAQPDGDGVWLADLATGTTRLMLSLAEIGRIVREHSPLLRGRLLVNHLTFNPSATRLVMLVRNFPAPVAGPEDPASAARQGWCTSVLTCDRDGGNVRVLVRGSYASHYWWADDERLLFYCDGPAGAQHYEIHEPSGRFAVIAPDFFRADGHMSLSPDGRSILYDSYPDAAGVQHLYLFDRLKRTGREVARFSALPVTVPDLRCDLHPRWSPDGRQVSFDSTHEGERALYLLELP